MWILPLFERKGEKKREVGFRKNRRCRGAVISFEHYTDIFLRRGWLVCYNESKELKGWTGMKVVFVCLGNICRSPMAEAVFRKMVHEEGLKDKITIDSAATSTWEHGNPVHHGTRKKLEEHGISAKGLVSRTLDATDLDADYILGMDASNVRNIHSFVDGKSDATVARLLEVAGVPRDIADPWYTGDFDATYRDVTLGCNALLEQLKKEL